MRPHWRPAGRTGRGGITNRDPVLHALTDVPAASVRDTGTRRAVCGARCWGVKLGLFDLDNPRSCRACIAHIEARS